MQELTGPQVPEGWRVEAAFRHDSLGAGHAQHVVMFRLTLPNGAVQNVATTFIVAGEGE